MAKKSAPKKKAAKKAKTSPKNAPKKKAAKKSSKKSKPTDIVVILDRSGSMESIAQPTVAGFNSFLNEQKKAKGVAFLTLTQFDSQYHIDYKQKPIAEVEDLILGKTYTTGSTTALYDAIGRTVNEINTENDVVVVIITDGGENASIDFNNKQINELIEDKKKSGWTFIFLGANQDAIAVGGSLGISANNSATWNSNSKSVSSTYNTISEKLTSYRSSKMGLDVNPDILNFTDKDRGNINK